ncbi:MAG: DUF1073 domain-containing protein, partial [bacterium]|nr:DUF1073 domain-containing protein [bacterium]
KAFTADSFQSVMKSIGTSKDPRTSITYEMGIYITQIIANNLYTYNWLAAKVVDAPVDDATRKWRNLLIPNVNKKKEIEEAMVDHDIKAKVIRALKYARIYGGAVILVVIDNEDPEDPLVVENIRPDSTLNFIVLDRYNIYHGALDQNILSPNFGQSEHYFISREGVRIHHSRLYKFYGKISTLLEFERQNYWGNSLFTRLWEPISDSQITSQSISNLIYEACVDVYGIEGLNEMVAEGSNDLVVERLRLAAEMKGILNGIALDGADTYEKKSATFANLPEIDDRFIQKVSGASNIPVTRLVGISPSGMNATGESDMYNYYDYVQAFQENEIRPALDWIDSILQASLFSTMPAFEYIFNPLKQLTEQEQSK